MRSELLREVQALHHFANRALVSHPITDVLLSTTDALAAILHADRVSIIGFNRELEAVDYFLEGGEGKNNVITTVPYEELWAGLSGWVLREGTYALSSKEVPDLRESAQVQARRLATNCGSILVVPVRNNERILATITAINRLDQRDFDNDDVEAMTIFAISTSVLIETAKLMADLQLARDLAEVSRAELAAQHVMKDKLFTIIAHDLRGPVGNLNALLAVVEETPLSVEELNDVVREGHRTAAQTYSLLDNLLGWVRAQMSEVKVLRTRFVAIKNLVSVRSWLESQARSKGITLELECPPEMTVNADERMFETIIRNLVSNAVKYSHENSSVTIRASRRNDAVVVEVEDHGAGAPPEKLIELFRRRTMNSELGTKGERGSGLGLMFCTDLATALGGHLEAESTMAVGSKFRLVLPDPVEGEL